MAGSKGVRASAENAGDTQKRKSPKAVLVISALDMSWRLAIVVLVPIIGGFELDKHLGTTPVLTIIGFILAMIGLFLILKRTLADANSRFNEGPR